MQPASEAVVDRGSLLKVLGLAGLAGLAIGAGILFLLNQLDDRLNSYTELKSEFEEEVLGQIPRDRQARRGGDAQRAATREAIRRAAIARAASAELVAASRELRAQTAEIKRRIALRRAAAVVPADARVGFESDSAGD